MSTVTLDPVTHTYSSGLISYTSVSEVIRSVLPVDYSTVPADVLENARQRGVFVDKKFCEWLNNGRVKIPVGTPIDWVFRLQMLINWWERQKYTLIGTQIMLQQDKYLIAGTCDLLVRDDLDECVFDLKVVSSLQPSYQLQLGAYSWMSSAENVGIIHVTGDSVGLVPYDTNQCLEDWLCALDWYRTKKRLGG